MYNLLPKYVNLIEVIQFFLQKKSEEDKLKRKLYKYNHRTSRKGYANLVEELVSNDFVM